jgi:type IV pilus assembly protein PilE
MRQSGHAGFTLLELMIAVVIVAILAVIAYPSYRSYLIQSRRADAQQAILQLANRLEKFFTVCNEYTTRITQPWPTSFADCPSRGGSGGLAWSATSPGGHYQLAITGGTIASPSNASPLMAYTITATPTPGGSQVGDGSFRMDSTGLKQWDRNNNGSYESNENTWEKY